MPVACLLTCLSMGSVWASLGIRGAAPTHAGGSPSRPPAGPPRCRGRSGRCPSGPAQRPGSGPRWDATPQSAGWVEPADQVGYARRWRFTSLPRLTAWQGPQPGYTGRQLDTVPALHCTAAALRLAPGWERRALHRIRGPSGGHWLPAPPLVRCSRCTGCTGCCPRSGRARLGRLGCRAPKWRGVRRTAAPVSHTCGRRRVWS